jgi:cell wall assembly regulator SMI1
MHAIWSRIVAWLAVNAPAILADLQPGASEEEIAETEAFLGATLPDDVKDSYRIYNGQAGEGPSLIEYWNLLSLEGIRREWDEWKFLLDDFDEDHARVQPRGPIQKYWWHPSWIPITTDGSGNHLCLDLIPAPGGTVGQIIEMWHDDDIRPLIAPSFRAWLSDFADDLEAGRYVFDEAEGGLYREDQQP